MLKAVARRKPFEEVAAQIRDAIERGRYGPGEALPSERELMAACAVGRPSVRDALLMLQVQGHVVIQHGRRARVADARHGPVVGQIADFVARVSRDGDRLVDDVLEARLALELVVARRAAECATPATLRGLRDALEANRMAMHEPDAYLASDIAFHRAIAGMTGNVVYMEASRAVLSWLAEFRRDLLHVEGANLLSHDEHTSIAAAIASGDPDAAERTMRLHATRSHALYGTLIRAKARHTTEPPGAAKRNADPSPAQRRDMPVGSRSR